MKKLFGKKLLLTTFVVFIAGLTLAFVPHKSCGCASEEDGSYLTHFINSVSETVTGKTVIEKKPKSYK